MKNITTFTNFGKKYNGICNEIPEKWLFYKLEILLKYVSLFWSSPHANAFNFNRYESSVTCSNFWCILSLSNDVNLNTVSLLINIIDLISKSFLIKDAHNIIKKKVQYSKCPREYKIIFAQLELLIYKARRCRVYYLLSCSIVLTIVHENNANLLGMSSGV